jgi:hypothetical protein
MRKTSTVNAVQFSTYINEIEAAFKSAPAFNRKAIAPPRLPVSDRSAAIQCADVSTVLAQQLISGPNSHVAARISAVPPKASLSCIELSR